MIKALVVPVQKSTTIALEDARLHGGWLEAWGKPACGSAFRLTLPKSVGARLVGSPLPLVPDESDLSALADRSTLADRSAVIVAARLKGRKSAAIEDRR